MASVSLALLRDNPVKNTTASTSDLQDHMQRKLDRDVTNIKMSAITSPPTTELRPLHCLRHGDSRRGEPSPETELVHWRSALSPKPDAETCTRAFVKLVSQVIVLDHGEAYCIKQHRTAQRGGFILAHAGCEDFNFVEYEDAAGEVPTDFSISDDQLDVAITVDVKKVSFPQHI